MTAKDMHTDAHNIRATLAAALPHHLQPVGVALTIPDGTGPASGQPTNYGHCVLDALVPAVHELIAAELIHQADDFAERIRMHGLGRHSVDPCLRCEAWGQAEAVLRARARELGWEG